MKNVTLDELINNLGEEQVAKLFVEYFLRLVNGKIEVPDELKDINLLNEDK